MWPFKRKIITPTLPEIVEVNRSIRYTPDAPFLETVNPWLLFVCDDLQKAHPRHNRLVSAGARNVNRFTPADPVYGYTSTDFVLWKHKAGARSFAVPLDKPMDIYKNRPAWDLTGGQAMKVRGQLYEIGWEGIAELDEHYRNTVEFRRHKVLVVIVYHYEIEHVDGHIAMSLRNEALVSAWMYVGVKEFWDQHLDGTFEPVHKFPRRGSTPPHYYFTHYEYRS